MKDSAPPPHRPPVLSVFLTIFGCLSFLAAAVSLVELGSEAERNGTSYRLAAGAALAWRVTGLLLFAASSALRYLAALAHQAGRLDAAAPLPRALPTPETIPASSPPPRARPAAVPRYFYKLGDANYGPVPQAELQRLIDAGTVQMDTRIRLESSYEWTPLSEMAG